MYINNNNLMYDSSDMVEKTFDEMEDKNSNINDYKRLIEPMRKVCSPKKTSLNFISGNLSVTKQQIEEVKKTYYI